MKNKVIISFVGINGNAFSIMGHFKTQALKQGWTTDEVKEVTDRAMTGNYTNLLATIANECDLDVINPEDLE